MLNSTILRPLTRAASQTAASSSRTCFAAAATTSSATINANAPSSFTNSASSNGNGVQQHRSIHIEQRLRGLKIELPEAPLPKANYNIICLPPDEDIMYVSGHLPIKVCR